MEVFVVDFGDSYERWPIGVARSLDEARALARAYRTSLDSPHSFFAVERYTLGELGGPESLREDLDLEEE